MKKVMFTAFAVGLGLTANVMAQVPSYVPTNGLVGWWPFNGNANDESGNGLNGNVIGATLTSDRFGTTNNAYNFNYANWSPGTGGDEIFIPFNTILNTPNLSVSVWALRNSEGYSGQQHTIINRFQFGYSTPYGEHWQIKTEPSPSCLIKTQIIQSSGVSSFNTGPSLSLNNWFHIVMTFDGISIKQFINGALYDSIPANNLSLNVIGNSGISIGVSDQANGHWGPFDGKIDDIGIWNRALTSQEITNLYNGCQLSINTHPVSQTINISNNAQFVVGSSDPNANYQWQTDLGVGFQNLNSVGQYSGTTNDTLTVSNVTMTNNNQPFRCIVSSGSCSDTSNVAVLTVNNNVGIEEFTGVSTFILYPNPTQLSFEIQTNLVFNKIEIRDMQGRVVKTENSGKIINIALLQKGTYLVQLIDEKSKLIAVQKIVKE